MSDQLQLMTEKTKILGEIRELTLRLDGYRQELDDFNLSKESTLISMKESYKVEEIDKIETEYRDRIQDLVSQQTDLTNKMNETTVDESDESVAELRERKEYLNQVAIEIEKLLAALLSVSSEYYVDLAYTTETFSYKKYIKELKKLDAYIYDIERQNHRELLAIRFTKLLNTVLSDNLSIWISGVLAGPFAVCFFPYVFFRAIKRAKTLHRYSRKYHMMVQTADRLSNETSRDIANILEGVVFARKDTIAEQLQEIEKQLESIMQEKQAKIDELVYEDDKALAALEKTGVIIRRDIEEAEIQLKDAEDYLEDLTAQLDDLLGETRSRLKYEREPYINPRNIIRSVVFPGRFLYDYTDEKNIWAKITSGLFVYNSRVQAEGVVRNISYQMRNYMKWGALKIYVMDVLMGSCVNDLQFDSSDGPKGDLLVDAMKADHEARIELLHDILTRRRTVVKQVARDLNGYNQIQEAAGSSPMSFEILIHFLEQAPVLTEKVIQLLRVGEPLGVYVILLINREHLTIENIRMYEKYVGNVAEISTHGITYTPPEIFRANFEKANKKRQEKEIL